MANTVRVTSSQVNAAKLLVKHAEAAGRPIHPGIKKIAEARPARRAVEHIGRD